MSNPYTQQYTQVQTSTISPEKLMVLLYEGAVKFLGQAREELAAGRLSTGKTALSKGMAIIAELQNSLDLNAGWEGAQGLYDLYGYMTLELTEVNVHGELDRIEPVRSMLSELCQSWQEAIESQATQGTTAHARAAGAKAGARAPFSAAV